MSDCCQIVQSEGFEDSAIVLLARVSGNSRVPIKQADVTAISFAVHDTSDASLVGNGSLDAEDVIYDALQVDARWTKDSTGYNFLWEPSVTLWPDADTTYRIEVRFSVVNGQPYTIAFEHSTLALFSS